MTIKILKGGSLSKTSLHENATTEPFVRKEIDLSKDREYGFVRWQSQLKKTQLFHSLFPRVIPKILNVGVDKNTAFYDMAYIKEGRDIKTILNDTVNPPSDEVVKDIHSSLWGAFSYIHNSFSYCPSSDAAGNMRLYIQEEVIQKITDACKNPKFKKFYDLNSYTLNGRPVKGIDESLLERMTSELLSNAEPINETYILGNPTLENIMYIPEDKRSMDFTEPYKTIMFIDLYSESMIDIPLLDYAQVLQCSSSHYGTINDGTVSVFMGTVLHSNKISPALEFFNELFEDELKMILTPRHYKMVKLLEATQFLRMLPFKCLAGDIDKAKYFYTHACFLLRSILD